MIFIWGTKKTERTLGFAADFCPLCQRATPVQIHRIGHAKHVYWLPLGQGALVQHEAECVRCGYRSVVPVERYAQLAKRPPQNDAAWETFAYDTFPNLRAVHGDRLALVERIQSQPDAFSMTERQALIDETLQLAAEQAEERLRGPTRADAKALRAFALTMAFFVGFGLLVNFVLPKPVATALRFVLPVVFLFGLGYTFQRMLFSRGRWFRLQLLPAVVHSLTPWHVAHDEIESGLERLKDQGYLFPRKISADKLWTRLQSHTIQLRPLSSLSATSAAA